MSSNLKTNKKLEFLICFFNEVYAVGLSLMLWVGPTGLS